MIDLDANATTGMLPEVFEAMQPWLTGNQANPSGSYKAAKLARKAIDQARAEVADLINADPEEIFFTGSGTESVNTALNSLDKLAGEGSALVSAIEHSAVLRFVESRKREHELMPVDKNGLLDLDAFSARCNGGGYVSIMAANNETGMVQPLAEVIELARRNGLPIHSDAIQVAGKIPISVRDLSVDLLSISSHKFHGPKGIGALYVRKGLHFAPLIFGGGQEKNRRSGTENVPAIVAMGKAAQLAKSFLDDKEFEIIAHHRDVFESYLLTNVRGCVRNGDPEHRLPNTSHLSFEGCDSAGMLILLDEAGLACAAGSACMTGKQKPSHVQLAMGIPEHRAKTSLRFSFSRTNTLEEALFAAEKVKKCAEKLRNVQGSGIGPVAIYTS